MVVYSQGHVFLEVFKTLRNIGFYSERKFELINLLLVREMAEYRGPAPVLETLEVPLEEAEAHLSLGCSGAHDRVERLRNLVEACEGSAETLAVLVVGQGSGHAIEKKSDRCGNVFSEGLNILLVLASVPQ